MVVSKKYIETIRDSRFFVCVMSFNIVFILFLWGLGVMGSLFESAYISVNSSVIVSDTSLVGVSSVGSDGNIVLVDGSVLTPKGTYIIRSNGSWYSSESNIYLRNMEILDWCRLLFPSILGVIVVAFTNLVGYSSRVRGGISKLLKLFKWVIISLNLIFICSLLLILLL